MPAACAGADMAIPQQPKMITPPTMPTMGLLLHAQALSMGVHESQSLLWERMVALSRGFAAYLAPKLKAAFPQLPDFEVW